MEEYFYVVIKIIFYFGKDRAIENLTENIVDVAKELNWEVVNELSLDDDIQPSTHSDEK